MRRTMVLEGAVAILLAALGIASCSARDVSPSAGGIATDGNHGGIQLGLEPVSGITLTLVHYVVTNGATPPAVVGEGDLPTPGTSSDINLGLSLPVGAGYKVSLSASSAEPGDNITCGAAFGPFDVLPNTVNSVKLVLNCHDDTNGGGIPDLEVVTDACPRLVFDYGVAKPSIGSVGGPNIHVAAKAHDLDGKAVTYSWKLSSPPVGTFNPVTGADSDLTCNAVGAGLSATVTANNGDCTKSLSVLVSCHDDLSSCGNGVVDPGEACDKGIPGSNCPPDCIAECGNGLLEAPIEDCDPGNTDNCNALCKFRTPVCGDGFLTTVGPNPEVCDGNKVPASWPPDKKCNTGCSGDLLPAFCGNGKVEADEQCDDAVAPFPDGPESPTCSNTCKKVSTDACVVCENAGDCFESVDNCLGVVAPFSSNEQARCFDVMACIQASNCFDGTNTVGTCYCGSLNTMDCAAAPFTGPGSPNGACAAQIKAGFPTFTKNSEVLAGLSATKFPSGAAMKRLSCQKIANASACLEVCGFNAGGPAFP